MNLEQAQNLRILIAERSAAEGRVWSAIAGVRNISGEPFQQLLDAELVAVSAVNRYIGELTK